MEADGLAPRGWPDVVRPQDCAAGAPTTGDRARQTLPRQARADG